MPTILEDSAGMGITEKQADFLLEHGVICHCPDCGNDIYHISVDHYWEEIPVYLQKMEEIE